MYTVKLIGNLAEQPENIVQTYTALHCCHYEVSYRKDGSACITVYPTFLQTNGVDYQLGAGFAYTTAYIENDAGTTIDKVTPEPAERRGQDARERIEAALL